MSDEIGFTQDNRSLLISTPLGKDEVLLTQINGSEAVSSLFEYYLDLASENNALRFSDIVGKEVTVSIPLSEESSEKRFIHGIVTEFSQSGSDDSYARYGAVLRPTFWLATRSTDCRIFQDMSAIEIIKKVLDDCGITNYKIETASAYQARDYCVQYNETAFSFLSRLMEDEGIFYFFRHEEGAHSLVLADDLDHFDPCVGDATLTVAEQSRSGATVDGAAMNIGYVERVVTKQYQADDYYFETPSTELKTSASGEVSSGAEKTLVYEYPGLYRDTKLGETRASLRMEEFESASKELSASSHTKGLIAGGVFTLAGHDRADLNADYVIRSLTLDASSDHFANHFTSFPKDLPFRPARVTPKPRISGAQTAVVVGKSGEEIWTDEFGRVKVQFHWDQKGEKDDKASCWIRVVQGWAGANWGAFMLPRVGMEVVVSFINGDPDHPLVTGCVYNGEMTPPYPLPDEQTKSGVKSESSKGGGGFNEIRFEDKAGEEEIYIHAQFDYITDVENNRTATVIEGNDTLLIKKGDRLVTVETGNETTSIKTDRSMTVEGAQEHKTTGDYTETISGNYTKTVEGDYTLNVSGNLTINVDGDVKILAEGSLAQQAGSDGTLKTGTTLGLEAGSSGTFETGTDLTLEAGQNLNASSGMDTTLDAGMNLTGSAGVNAEISGGVNTTVSASASLSLSGSATAELSGGATASVSGAVTQLG